MRLFPLLFILFFSACTHLNRNINVSNDVVASTYNSNNKWGAISLKKLGIKGKVINVDETSVNSLEVDNRSIWSRISKGFRVPLTESVEREQQIKSYLRHPICFAKMLERSRPYLFHVVEKLEKRGMPMEIALIPFVESAYNPQALSSAKAAGIWQFIPSTGKEYKLRQNFFSDERRDVIASTDAALDYLEKLYLMFGDWKLALAAYNWGEGNLQRSIKRNLMHNRPVHYSALGLPRETRDYVPKIEAIKFIILNSTHFGIALPKIDNHPYFVTVTTARDIDIKVAAKLAKLSLQDFRALNPAFNRPVILGVTAPQILLPYENARFFEKGIKNYNQALSSWAAYRVRRSERPVDLANRLGISVKTLMAVNKIPVGVLLKSGSTVLVPKRLGSSGADIDAFVAENAVLAVEFYGASLKKRVIRTRSRFTVVSFAKTHKVLVSQLRQWNPKLPRRIIPVGTAITLRVSRNASVETENKKSRGVQVARHSFQRSCSKKTGGKRVVQSSSGSAFRVRRSVTKKQLVALKNSS